MTAPTTEKRVSQRRAPKGHGAAAEPNRHARTSAAASRTKDQPVLAGTHADTRAEARRLMLEEASMAVAPSTFGPDVVENPPNPARTIESLRQLGYENYAAVCDIADNAFDAGARNVWITVNRVAGDFEIGLADDGTGMAGGQGNILDQALRLGSDTDRDERTDLGKYGMGLVTASLSMSRRTTVLTRVAGGEVWVAQTDIDEIIRYNAFVKLLRQAAPDEEKRWASFYPKGGVPEHGTVVILDHSDHISPRDTGEFKKGLRNRLAETYRYFITSGRLIYLNEEKIEPFDPLFLDNPATDPYSDETYEVAIKTDDTGVPKTFSMRIRVAVLPDEIEQLQKYREVNVRNQGFYVVRNWRQIAAGQDLNVFEKHPEYNRIRMELFFSGEMDQLMGVRFTKHGVEPVQAIRDRIREAVRGQIATINNRIKKKTRRDNPDRATEAHDEAAKVIASKSALLVKPEVEIEKREPREPRENVFPRPEPKDQKERKERRQLTRTALATRDLNCRFERASLGRTGPIFESSLEGKTVVIAWNEDHPFYEAYVLKNADDKEIVGGIDFLAYSLASAIHKIKNDENVEMLENIMTYLSQNMRVLLS